MSREDTARGHKTKSRKPKYFLQTLRKQLFHSMGTGKFFSWTQSWNLKLLEGPVRSSGKKGLLKEEDHMTSLSWPLVVECIKMRTWFNSCLGGGGAVGRASYPTDVLNTWQPNRSLLLRSLNVSMRPTVLNAHHVPGAVLGTKDTAVHTTHQAWLQVYSPVRERE